MIDYRDRLAVRRALATVEVDSAIWNRLYETITDVLPYLAQETRVVVTDALYLRWTELKLL